MKRSLKALVAPFMKRLVHRPRGMSLGKDSYFRRPWYITNPDRIEIGARARIGRHVVINAMGSYEGVAQNGHVRLGDDVYLGSYTQIHAMNPLEIGDGVVISEHVYISDTSHRIDPREGLIMKQPLETKGPVRIGRHVFLGYGCSILPGVTLGDHAVVGARALVTRDVPPYSLVAGSPARVIKTFDNDTGRWESVNRKAEA